MVAIDVLLPLHLLLLFHIQRRRRISLVVMMLIPPLSERVVVCQVLV
jgi:hypothetical protein